MVKNIVFILTEGDHDSAFIFRILKSHGFTTYKKIIKDFPPPLNNFLMTDILNVTISEVKIQEAKTRFLPNHVVESGNNIIMVYSIGGESKDANRISLIKAVNAFNVRDIDAFQAIKDTKISVLYFFDADEEGVKNRIEQIRRELSIAFSPEKIPTVFTSSEIYLIDDIGVGGYIFTEVDKDTGLLEDILIPLMKDDNDDIFKEADAFLSMHNRTALFRGKVTTDKKSGDIKKVNGQKFSYKKSLVGTVGQLQKSGKSNTVCISDSDYLNDTKIKANLTCIDIHGFIKKAMI